MPRAPLTEEQKQVLRDRLAKARAAKKQQPKPAPAEPKVAKAKPSLIPSVHAPWTENDWMTRPIQDCRARLALLKGDFEVGSRIVGQRPDVNPQNELRCFVCQSPVADGKWKIRRDYLNKHTNLFESIVIGGCAKSGIPCTAIFQNDSRLKRHFKDIVDGSKDASEPIAPVEIPA